MGELFAPIHLVVLGIVSALLNVVPLWMILGKAGLPRWPAVFAILPPINIFVLFYVALVRWPARIS